MQNYLLRTLLIGSLLVTPLARGSSTDDVKIVAALDTEYQAAVKNNDAATMDRILSDLPNPSTHTPSNPSFCNERKTANSGEDGISVIIQHAFGLILNNFSCQLSSNKPRRWTSDG